MKPVLTVEEMREVDARATDGCSAQGGIARSVLVERAGTALARSCLSLLGGGYGRRVVVVAGKGNNGEDGRVAARRLRRRGALVTVVDAAGFSGGALPSADLVVDAAYGTGFRGSYRAPGVAPGVKVVACDIPSGVDGDTGEARGEPLRCDLTVTFAALKPGLIQGDGVLLSGHVEVVDIGLDVSKACISVVEDRDIALLPPRPRESHKWQSALAIVAGSPGMTGAAELCARAAYRGGAGMVRLGIPGAGAAELPRAEAVSRALPARGWATEALAMAERCRALVVGPGLGRDEGTLADVRRIVAMCPVPVVVDADGLFALGDASGVASCVSGRTSPVVLTPHEGEYRRLSGTTAGGDRLSAASQLALRSRSVVLLKGSTTVVSEPASRGEQEPVRKLVSLAGSPRLATAGTGDVLSGLIGAFVARGMDLLHAAALAAHVHGRAASLGPREGLVAGDIADLVARWLSGSRRG